MTSKEIIIKLIDEHKISGEEAYELIRSIENKPYVTTCPIQPYTPPLPPTNVPITWQDYEITC